MCEWVCVYIIYVCVCVMCVYYYDVVYVCMNITQKQFLTQFNTTLKECILMNSQGSFASQCQ